MKFVIVLAAVVVLGNCLPFNFQDNFPGLKTGILFKRSNSNTVNMIFMFADDNRNGLLSASELAEYTVPGEGMTSEERAAKTVRMGDTNGDNELSKAEFLALLDSLEQSTK